MFNKDKFAQIIKNIKETYNSQEEFAEKSGIGRTYLSQYMNMKLDKPPKPEILVRLADASNGIVTYRELMDICGYLKTLNLSELIKSNNIKKVIEDSTKDTGIIQLILNLNTDDFSKEEKNILYKYISSWEKNENIDINELIKDCSIESQNKILREYNKFHADFNSLLERKRQQNKNDKIRNYNFYLCPVYGRISAGEPNWAEECMEGKMPVDPELMNIINPEECYFLKVNGESMNKVIKNGAFALIRKTDWVENGEIAVVLVNGFDATLKKFTKQGDLVILEPMSDDSSFTTQVYNKDTEIKVIGKYIGKMEMN